MLPCFAAGHRHAPHVSSRLPNNHQGVRHQAQCPSSPANPNKARQKGACPSRILPRSSWHRTREGSASAKGIPAPPTKPASSAASEKCQGSDSEWLAVKCVLTGNYNVGLKYDVVARGGWRSAELLRQARQAAVSAVQRFSDSHPCAFQGLTGDACPSFRPNLPTIPRQIRTC